MKSNYYVIVVLWLIAAPLRSHAQTTVQVVEKTITRSIDLSAKDRLILVAEKADIQMEGWDKQYLSLEIVFRAKHTSRTVAEKELAFMKYAVSREANIIEIRNSFIIPAEVQSIQSSLTIGYKLKVPQKTIISLQDKYGDIEIKNLSSTLTLQSAFGNIQLDNIGGVLTLQTSFTEIDASTISGNLTCTAEKSQLRFSGIEGSASFYTSFGSIELEFGKSVQNFFVKSSRTSVVLRSGKTGEYNYQLETKFGTIHVPEPFQQWIKKEGSITGFSYATGQKTPLIKVQTSYSPITLKN